MNEHVKQEGHTGCVLQFPGRWIGGTALVVGPLLLLTGVLLRLQFHFFFPEQLEAVLTHPKLMDASYSFFAAGNLLMWPAIIILAGLIGTRNTCWGLWGGVFAIFGLFVRTFHSGVDHLAFQLVRNQNPGLAVKIIADSYGAFHIFSTFNLAVMLGWAVLAIGAYRSGTFGLLRSLALALMAALPIGVLKGTTPFSIAATFGLCAALVPLGIKILCEGPSPGLRTVSAWIIGVAAAGCLFYFFGLQG